MLNSFDIISPSSHVRNIKMIDQNAKAKSSGFSVCSDYSKINWDWKIFLAIPKIFSQFCTQLKFGTVVKTLMWNSQATTKRISCWSAAWKCHCTHRSSYIQRYEKKKQTLWSRFYTSQRNGKIFTIIVMKITKKDSYWSANLTVWSLWKPAWGYKIAHWCPCEIHLIFSHSKRESFFLSCLS